MLDHIKAAVRRDWEKTCSLVGYLRRRLGEVSTWTAIGASFVTANSLSQPYAAGSILVALVIAMLPSKAMAPTQ